MIVRSSLATVYSSGLLLLTGVTLAIISSRLFAMPLPLNGAPVRTLWYRETFIGVELGSLL